MARRRKDEQPVATAAATWEDVSTLTGWAGNPRRNDGAVEPVARSIAVFGFGAPILARAETREIVAGHTRARAMAYLDAYVLEDGRTWRPRTAEDGPHVVQGAPGPGMAPVRLLEGLTEAQAHALALADNRLGEIAEWDDEGLTRELRALQDDPGFLDGLDLLGWSDEELDALIDPPVPPSSPPPAPPEPPPALPGAARIHVGRCEDVMRGMEAESFDSCVCDPPYGLSEGLSPEETVDLLAAWSRGEPWRGRERGFMGREWDAFVPGPDVWREVFRLLKPGAHVVAFAGTRTEFYLTLALQLAGFEIRDVGQWAYFNGFPKSLDVSKAIDDAAGVIRKDRVTVDHGMAAAYSRIRLVAEPGSPVTDGAKAAQGLGTALKPALEPWVLARKPLGRRDGHQRTVADCVQEFGTGALNIDACRFRDGDPMWLGPNEGPVQNHGESGNSVASSYALGARVGVQTPGQAIGRWPTNLVHVRKPTRTEREAGCDHVPPRKIGIAAGPAGWKAGDVGMHNHHPTLKPIRLMAWLARLATPRGGRLLDPFAGSGTCGAGAVPQGYSYDGIEVDPDYARIAEARVAHWAREGLDHLPAWDAEDEDENEDPESGDR